MSLWWMWGGESSPAVGAAEVNFPSLWSGGVTWEAAAAGTGTQGYWQSSANATARAGIPHLSVAVGGGAVRHTVRHASFGCGKSEWLGSVQPSSASVEVEGAFTFAPMQEVVFGVLSDTTDQHSDALWVGYVDDINATTETSGRVVSSVSCIDVIGRLGQAKVPDTFPVATFPDSGIATTIEMAAAATGTYLVVEDDSVFSQDDGTIVDFEDGETLVGFLNRCEQADNLNLFCLGSGKLVIQRRWYEGSPDLDPAPTPVVLSGTDAPSTWTRRTSPTTIVNHWGDAGFTLTAAMSESRETYGQRTYASIPEDGSNGYQQLVDTGVMNESRPLLSGASFHVTDLGHAALFLDPNDWVTLDGDTYQVLSTQHDVDPGRRWSVTITGDSTQALLHAEYS